MRPHFAPTREYTHATTMRDIELQRRTLRAPPTAAYEIRLGAKPTRAIAKALTEKLKAKLPKSGLVIWMPRSDGRLKILVDRRLTATKVNAIIQGTMLTKYQTRGTAVAAWREFR